ncbi:hypothetical protein BH09VER1_BH09VER1_28530 [soil metagenome]
MIAVAQIVTDYGPTVAIAIGILALYKKMTDGEKNAFERMKLYFDAEKTKDGKATKVEVNQPLEVRGEVIVATRKDIEALELDTNTKIGEINKYVHQSVDEIRNQLQTTGLSQTETKAKIAAISREVEKLTTDFKSAVTFLGEEGKRRAGTIHQRIDTIAQTLAASVSQGDLTHQGQVMLSQQITTLLNDLRRESKK